MNVYEIVTEKVIEALDKGVVPWQRPWRVSGMAPANLNSKRAYRGINTFLLSISAMSLPNATPWWMTFKGAQELGGSVKKGEKGTFIVFWKKTEYKKTNEETGDEELKKGMMLRYYYVFNLCQTEGIDEKKIPKAVEQPEVDIVERAEEIVKSYPMKVIAPPAIRYVPQDRAYYTPASDTVVMPSRKQFNSTAALYSVLFHELTHSTGHKDRLDRFKEGSLSFGSETYAAEELVAEMGAAFLCAEAGIEPEYTNAAAYIANWKQKLKDDGKLVVYAAARAQKAADFVMGREVATYAD